MCHSKLSAAYGLAIAQDYYLNDIRPSDGPLNANVCGYLAYSDTSPTDCETRCDAAAGCAGFVHVADNNCCFLKGNVDSPSANSRTIAHLKTGELLAGGSDQDSPVRLLDREPLWWLKAKACGG